MAQIKKTKEMKKINNPEEFELGASYYKNVKSDVIGAYLADEPQLNGAVVLTNIMYNNGKKGFVFKDIQTKHINPPDYDPLADYEYTLIPLGPELVSNIASYLPEGGKSKRRKRKTKGRKPIKKRKNKRRITIKRI